MITGLLIRTCNHFALTVAASACESESSSFGGLGPYWAQLFQKIVLEIGDMQAFCHYTYLYCNTPPVIKIDESMWFSPKPESQETAPPPSGMLSIKGRIIIKNWLTYRKTLRGTTLFRLAFGPEATFSKQLSHSFHIDQQLTSSVTILAPKLIALKGCVVVQSLPIHFC
jgi:hypothetical protein